MKTLNRGNRGGQKQKGQIFTVDLIMAATIFLFVLTLTIIYSNQVANRAYYWDKTNEREHAALLASRTLVLSPGEPSNWEQLSVEDASSIGLASSRNVIDSRKLQRFAGLNQGNYSDAKALLGLSKYDVRVTISGLNRQLLESFGLEPDANKETSSLTRVALYNGEAVLVKVKVFE